MKLVLDEVRRFVLYKMIFFTNSNITIFVNSVVCRISKRTLFYIVMFFNTNIFEPSHVPDYGEFSVYVLTLNVY